MHLRENIFFLHDPAGTNLAGNPQAVPGVLFPMASFSGQEERTEENEHLQHIFRYRKAETSHAATHSSW
jgi:hypothetical protein